MKRSICSAKWAVTGLAFFLVTMGCGAETGDSAAKTASETQTDTEADSGVEQPEKNLVVYYFHGNARCPTCLKLEKYAREAIESAFPDALEDGRVAWKAVNVEKAGNEHFTTDYKLYTKSVVVSVRTDGEESSWKNLDQIWQLVRDEQKYKKYITKQVEACMEGSCS